MGQLTADQVQRQLQSLNEQIFALQQSLKKSNRLPDEKDQDLNYNSHSSHSYHSSPKEVVVNKSPDSKRHGQPSSNHPFLSINFDPSDISLQSHSSFPSHSDTNMFPPSGDYKPFFTPEKETPPQALTSSTTQYTNFEQESPIPINQNHSGLVVQTSSIHWPLENDLASHSTQTITYETEDRGDGLRNLLEKVNEVLEDDPSEYPSQESDLGTQPREEELELVRKINSVLRMDSGVDTYCRFDSPTPENIDLEGYHNKEEFSVPGVRNHSHSKQDPKFGGETWNVHSKLFNECLPPPKTQNSCFSVLNTDSNPSFSHHSTASQKNQVGNDDQSFYPLPEEIHLNHSFLENSYYPKSSQQLNSESPNMRNSAKGQVSIKEVNISNQLPRIHVPDFSIYSQDDSASEQQVSRILKKYGGKKSISDTCKQGCYQEGSESSTFLDNTFSYEQLSFASLEYMKKHNLLNS